MENIMKIMLNRAMAYHYDQKKPDASFWSPGGRLLALVCNFAIP